MNTQQSSHLLLRAWSCSGSSRGPDRISASSRSRTESGLNTRPDSHANASKLLSVRHKRFDKTPQQVPPTANTQITSAGEEPGAFKSEALKHLGKSPEERRSRTQAPAFCSSRSSSVVDPWIGFLSFLPALESAVFALELTLDVLEITKSRPAPRVKPKPSARKVHHDSTLVDSGGPGRSRWRRICFSC